MLFYCVLNISIQFCGFKDMFHIIHLLLTLCITDEEKSRDKTIKTHSLEVLLLRSQGTSVRPTSTQSTLCSVPSSALHLHRAGQGLLREAQVWEVLRETKTKTRTRTIIM